MTYYQHGPSRRAELRSEHDKSRRVGLEQILNALTPPHKRNPADIQRAITRDGYAVYDGGWWHNAATPPPLDAPHRVDDQPSGLRGTTTDRRGASDDYSHSPH